MTDGYVTGQAVEMFYISQCVHDPRQQALVLTDTIVVDGYVFFLDVSINILLFQQLFPINH